MQISLNSLYTHIQVFNFFLNKFLKPPNVSFKQMDLGKESPWSVLMNTTLPTLRFEVLGDYYFSTLPIKSRRASQYMIVILTSGGVPI